MTSKIQQTKLNSISAKILHRKSKWRYELINGTVLFLTIIVPLLFIIAQYVSKGTKSENLINNISFVSFYYTNYCFNILNDNKSWR